jgi:hypothetical protein
MLNDEIVKEIKFFKKKKLSFFFKKKYQPTLTFQIRDSGHQTGSTISRKIIKFNP